uniref:H.polymorpha DL1 DNA for region containing 9 open reading frames n=1 Tax=Pichia angusta TaxID=870730 RepID=Q04292_PICAN|nr:unnamed protein product [Ogataea angusta]
MELVVHNGRMGGEVRVVRHRRSASERRVATSKVRFSSSTVKAVLESGCKKLLTKEPKITLYDTVAGDGDCGETLANGPHASWTCWLPTSWRSQTVFGV